MSEVKVEEDLAQKLHDRYRDVDFRKVFQNRKFKWRSEFIETARTTHDSQFWDAFDAVITAIRDQDPNAEFTAKEFREVYYLGFRQEYMKELKLQEHIKQVNTDVLEHGATVFLAQSRYTEPVKKKKSSGHSSGTVGADVDDVVTPEEVDSGRVDAEIEAVPADDAGVSSLVAGESETE